MWTSQVVIATKVSEGLEGLLVDLNYILIHEALESVDETYQLDIFPRSLESQQAIDHIVTARGLLTEVDDSDFESLLIRHECLELLVKRLEYLILKLEVIID